MSLTDRIRQVIASVFGLPLQGVPPEADATGLANWTSLGHLEVMMAVEQEFGVHIPTETMPELLSIASIEKYLRVEGVADSE